MKLRIDEDLLLWLEVEVNGILLIHNPNANKGKLLRSTLHEFAKAGYAKRYLDARGRIAWSMTDKLRQHLEEEEVTEFFAD
jgi:hypothetical protein